MAQRKKPKGVRNTRCVCGKVPFYSEEAVVFHLTQAQKQAFLDPARKECRFYLCDIAEHRQKSNGEEIVPIWHLTSMTVEKHNHRVKVWLRATIWTCGVRGMPSIVLTKRQMEGRVSTNPWRTTAVVRVVIRKRKE